MKPLTKKAFQRSLFIFRRDLRLDDNTSLLSCLASSNEVIPCFLFDDKQLNPKLNPFFGDFCVQFMIQSLKDLDQSLSLHNSRLFLFKGEYPDLISQVLEKTTPQAVYLNEDYSPYSIQRDNNIKELCKKSGISFFSLHDSTLLEKNKVLLSTGNFYKKFTPYYKTAIGFPVSKPQKNEFKNYIDKTNEFANEFPKDKIDSLYQPQADALLTGGRTQALEILSKIKTFSQYARTRDFPTLPTTRLSAYNKFGCVSIREVYWKVKELGSNAEVLLRQLYWRDFYYYILFYYPEVIEGAMKPNYKKVVWENNLELFNAWKEGRTGCPIVDAGMRCLNKTGYMHNRLRMIVSNYLVKILLVDWRWGEQYFASKLSDYDVAQNNGGWQWSASTGTDSQPYFRIFNPKLQSEKFDSKCEYILKWIPELKKVLQINHIHDWENFGELNKKKVKIDYPLPIVSYKERKVLCLEMFKKAVGTEEVKTGKGMKGEGESDSEEEKTLVNKKRK